MTDEVSYRPATLRLQARCRWAGPLFALATLMPYEIAQGNPQFLWHLIGELPPAGLLAYIAPGLAGLAAILASFWIRRGTALALTVLGVLIGATVFIRLGADATAWEVLPLPDSISRRTAGPVLTLSMVAAGISLSFPEITRKWGNGLLIGAIILALGYYSWPIEGEAPFQTVFRVLSYLGEVPHWQIEMGLIILATIALWPALIAILGSLHLRWPPKERSPIMVVVALYGLPLLLSLLILRSLAMSADGWQIFAGVAGALVLGGLVALLSSALEVLITDYVELSTEQTALRKSAIIALTTLAILSLGQWWLARPPQKGIEWALGDRVAEADALFGEQLPAWNRARLNWTQRTQAASGARAMLQVKKAGRLAIKTAKSLDPALGQAIEHLIKDGHQLSVAGRTWARLVGQINDATRQSGLPYYLDPTIYTLQTQTGPRRFFRMRTYHVVDVNRYQAAGEEYATLHVRRLDRASGGSPLLGFSRDRQPFAIIDLNEVNEFAQSLAKGIALDPPTCGEPQRTEAAREGLKACGHFLAEVHARLKDLGPALVALTDRHELQHQIDGPHLSTASEVYEVSGGAAFKKRLNRELSAYIAEMTGPGDAPYLGLIHLIRFAIEGGGSDLYYVGVMAIGTMGNRVLHEGAEVDRGALIETFSGLFSLEADKIRARAKAAWKHHYGQDLVSVSVTK